MTRLTSRPTRVDDSYRRYADLFQLGIGLSCTTTMSIAIFPASGGLGTATLTHLVEVLPPSDITLISRHPERHSALHARGAVTRRADFDDATSFDGVFSGVKTLNLISYPSIQIDHRFIVSALLQSFSRSHLN